MSRELFEQTMKDAAQYAEAAELYLADAELDEDTEGILARLQDAYADDYVTQEFTLGTGEYIRLEIFTREGRGIRRAWLIRSDYPHREKVQFTDEQADKIAAVLGIIEY